MTNSPDSGSNFRAIGGARIGSGLVSFNASWPFAKLEIGGDALLLTCLWLKWAFPKESITRLSKHYGAFSSGFRIEHKIERYNPFIVFWTFRVSALQAALAEFGYHIS
jgi:hypothetical protein